MEIGRFDRADPVVAGLEGGTGACARRERRGRRWFRRRRRGLECRGDGRVRRAAGCCGRRGGGGAGLAL